MLHFKRKCNTKSASLCFHFLKLLFSFHPITFRRSTADHETMTHYIKIISFITRILILNPILCWHITPPHSGSFAKCRAEPFILLTGIKEHSKYKLLRNNQLSDQWLLLRSKTQVLNLTLTLNLINLSEIVLLQANSIYI